MTRARMSLKKLVTVLALAIVVVTPLTACAGTPSPSSTSTSTDLPGQVRYTSSAYAFSIVFPGKPTENNSQQTVANETVVVTQVVWTSGSDQFEVQAAKLPASAAGQDGDTVMKNTLAGLTSHAVGAKLSSQSVIVLSDQRAMQAVLTLSTGLIVHAVVSVHGGVIYLILMANGTAATRTAFVQSLAFAS